MKRTKVQTLGAKCARCSVAVCLAICVVDGASNMSLAVTQARCGCIRGLSGLEQLLRCFRGSHICFINLYSLLGFNALPDSALHLDGKAWPHPQTARLT